MADDGGHMDGLQTMGIINALKTGNVQLDLIIAMCIPLFIRFIFSNMESIGDTIFCKDFWMKWISKNRGYHERFLVSKSIIETGGYYGTNSSTLDHDTQNSVLIKAIKLYVHSKCNLKLESANLDLTSTTTASKGENGYYSDEEDEDGTKTLVGMLSEYKLVKRPLSNKWHDLGLYGTEKTLQKVELQVIEAEDTVGSKKAERQRSTLTYHLRSYGATSIDVFVEKAYEWYLDELRKLEDNSRYYYELQSVKSEDDGGATNYKRFKLSDDKTFHSLFFPVKEKLLNVVNHFTNRSGKYAIKGYPHKLGLLLHGPPGTGKTSLIKALAQHTGRSIVNVPLSKISTNAELQAVFFDQRYHLPGESVPIKLNFKDVIFVLEDVDAASNVVKRRDGKTTADVLQVEHVDMPPAKSIWRMLIESNDDDCQELVKTLMEKSERLKKEATKSETLKSLASGMSQIPGLSLVGSTDEALSRLGATALETADSTMNAKDTVDRFLSSHVKPLKALLETVAEVDDALVHELLSIPGESTSIQAMRCERETSYEYYPDGDVAATGESLKETEKMLGSLKNWLLDEKKADNSIDKMKKWSASSFVKDGLNLTGLLNVLDGVVDTPGRFLVMTTNHPELLDPALIRPGRIDKKILLGYMNALDVIKMLEHYFTTKLDARQTTRVNEAIHGDSSMSRPHLNLTPAQVEQLAAEHDELDDMILALAEKGSQKPTQTNKRSSSLSFDV